MTGLLQELGVSEAAIGSTGYRNVAGLCMI